MSHHDAHRNFVTHEFAADLVRRVSVALSTRARVTPIKGALLGRAYYDDVAERPMTDVDILVTDISLRAALKALASAGFRRLGWSSDLGVGTLSHPSVPHLIVDLHRYPLPPGIGRITNRWLLKDATIDDTLFGARVFLPNRTRLLAHTLGVIANDDVYRAHRHSLADVNRLVRMNDVEEDVRTIADAGLRIASTLALRRVDEEMPSEGARALLHALTLSERERSFVDRLHAELKEAGTSPVRPLRAKIVSRLLADTNALRAVSVIAAIAGKGQARLLNRWRKSP